MPTYVISNCQTFEAIESTADTMKHGLEGRSFLVPTSLVFRHISFDVTEYIEMQ